MGFWIERADGTARQVSGYKFAAPRWGTRTYTGDRLGVEALPPRVDLRPLMTTVEDQGETNSCVANAVAGAYEYLVKRHLGEDAYDVSRMFIYYNARSLDEDADAIADEGSVIGRAIDGLREYGACSEATWPFDPACVNDEPSAEAYDEAAAFLVEDSELVPTELDAWRRCLAEGYPIVFGVQLFRSFDAHKKRGLVPHPSPREASRESHGGHAMLCVGYSDRDGVFIVRNSWGEAWGDDGYCYIPYRYLMNERFNCGDSWIIKRLDNVPVDAGAWGDDRSIVEDLGSGLAAMDDDAYGALLDAVGEFPLEARLALLFLHAANADAEVGDDELAGVAAYLGEVLEAMNIQRRPEKILRRCASRMGDEALLQETVELLGEHLSKSVLAGILAKLEAVVSADEMSDEEASFLDELVEAWQVDRAADDEA